MRVNIFYYANVPVGYLHISVLKTHIYSSYSHISDPKTHIYSSYSHKTNRSHFKNRLLRYTVTVFILFAASTWAWIITTDFCCFANWHFLRFCMCLLLSDLPLALSLLLHVVRLLRISAFIAYFATSSRIESTMSSNIAKPSCWYSRSGSF